MGVDRGDVVREDRRRRTSPTMVSYEMRWLVGWGGGGKGVGGCRWGGGGKGGRGGL